ncbi:MAG: hypothetical protein LBD40_00900 [Puniceicoccales bacterium]|jgi:hypothetical protein|nr:hypothetical protein [Puniceicoccales bacterium]
MNIKIRKLIFSCAVGCSCLWFPVSAFADWTLTDVLKRVNLAIVDLQRVGVYEEAQSILQRENERATQEIAALDVHFQYFAIRVGTIQDKAAQDAANAIQSLCCRRRDELGQQKSDQNTALGHQRQEERWRREAEAKLLREPRPPEDPRDPQDPQ